MSEDERIAKLKARYGSSEHGNFFVCDTIGVPHPFVVGTALVAHAADRFGGMLGKEAIEDLERKMRGPSCAMRGCNLKFAEHKQALLVECRVEMRDSEGKACPELHAYLLRINPLCEEDRYEGFAFLDRTRKARPKETKG